MKLSNTLFGLGLSVLAAGAAAAQGTARETPGQKPSAPPQVQITPQENALLDQLHGANIREIAAGKLAQRHAESPEVKQYGEHLVKEHSQADQELWSLARQAGVKLPEVGPGKLDQLERLRGKDFDRAFLNAMVKDHEKVIAHLRETRPQVNNPEVRAFVDKTLPTLQHHEQQAKKLSSSDRS